MKSIVHLTTTGLSRHVSITTFQFGTISAPSGSYDLGVDSVPAGSTEMEIFWLERDVIVPDQDVKRYNLHFQVDENNSANLQIRISPLQSGTAMDSRWSAPMIYRQME